MLRGCTDPKDILGEDGLLKQLQKRLIERALAAAHGLLRLPSSHPQGDLHHQRHRVAELLLAQGTEKPGGAFPNDESILKVF